MESLGYKRFPTIHNDKIVFVCEDDLWEVRSDGGIARRLTSNSGEVLNPYYSPDGKYIAFSGKEEGEKDVYVIPALGGANKRVTYIGKNTKVIGWTPDSKYILFSTDAKGPFMGRSEIYKVSLKGGVAEKLSYGIANNIAFGPDGGVLLGKNTMDPARWKRYKGGTAGVFWIDKKGTGKFEKFLKDIGGNLASPMWINDRIYFICDHEGIGKLYSCNLKGGDINSHSNNAEYYIRNANTDGKKIVYHAGGEIFEYDIENNEERKVNIDYHSPQIQRQRKFTDAEKYLQDYNIGPKGLNMAITSRGKSFYFSNWEGPVTQIGKPHGVRYRQTQWLFDKENMVTISDDGGFESIEMHNIKEGKKSVKRLKDLNIGIIARLRVSPTENIVAVSNNRFQLFLIDLKSEKITEIAKSKFDRIEDFCFSPDGNLICYSMANANFLSSLYLYDIEKNENHQITSKGFSDYQPTFDPDGRYIYFLSAREFNPVYDTSYFQLGFPLGVRPYLLSLRKDTLSPFTEEYSRLFPRKHSDREDEMKDEKDDKKETKKTKKIKIDVDYENISDRIISFPLPEKNYLQIQAVKDGLVFSREPVKGALHHWYFEKHSSDEKLELFDFNTQKSERIADKVVSFKVSMNGKSLVYRSENKLFLKSDIFEENGYDSHHKDHSKSKSGWIDLSRVKVNLDPVKEWEQMYNEAWRLQKEQFWSPDMSGIDWDLVYKRYHPLLEKVATRSEFSDLIWEMQGELGTSHAYEMGGDYKAAPNYRLGSLGADYIYDEKEKAYKIIHIIKGDSWKNNSPLRSLGVDVKEGDFIISINGETLNAEVTPNSLLVNKAKNFVNVEIKSASTGKSKTFNIKTNASDFDARYRERVENLKAYVHEKSNGKLGYVHIPDMGPGGFSEFHRNYIMESSKDGLVIDLRDNRGGHVSQLLLEMISRKQIGYDLSRHGSTGTYPSHSVAGPLVCVTDEFAGSDGDIFSHNFKQMKLGTLVGKRTWGGVVGIHPRLELADGTITTQPEYATYMKDVGYGVENYGTDPDIEVDITPQDFAQGKDPQLDKAISVALAQLKKNPVKLPKFDKKPKLSLFNISKNGNGAVKKKLSKV